MCKACFVCVLVRERDRERYRGIERDFVVMVRERNYRLNASLVMLEQVIEISFWTVVGSTGILMNPMGSVEVV